MTEPFFVGGPIPSSLADRFFYGLEEERRLLAGFLHERTPGSFGIFGAPSSGKTSLVMYASSKVLIPRVHVNAGRTWPATRTAFYRNLAEAVGAPPPASADLDVPPAVFFQTLPVPKRGTRGVLVIEDAHDLVDLDPAFLPALPDLYLRLPFHVILTGERSILENATSRSVDLRPFSEATTSAFVERQFREQGIVCEPDALSTLYEFSSGQPATVQRLGLITWQRLRRQGKERLTRDEVELSVAEIVDILPTSTVSAWASTRGLMRDIFIAMCLYDLSSPTEIARRLQLEPKNTVVLLRRLESVHRLVERSDRGVYRVREPLLKHYVRKEWASPIIRS